MPPVSNAINEVLRRKIDSSSSDICSRCLCVREPDVTPVLLNVYDVGRFTVIRQLNNGLRSFGQGGLFHVAIEVHDWEWSFGMTVNPDDPGVYKCVPRANPDHNYRCTVKLLPTALPPSAVQAMLAVARGKWTGGRYDVLRNNCGHFCESLALALGAGPLPRWVLFSSKTSTTIEEASAGAVGGIIMSEDVGSPASAALKPKATPKVVRAQSFEARPSASKQTHNSGASAAAERRKQRKDARNVAVQVAKAAADAVDTVTDAAVAVAADTAAAAAVAAEGAATTGRALVRQARTAELEPARAASLAAAAHRRERHHLVPVRSSRLRRTRPTGANQRATARPRPTARNHTARRAQAA
jgi:hypothetical protein